MEKRKQKISPLPGQRLKRKAEKKKKEAKMKINSFTEEAVASSTGIAPLEGTEMETQSVNSYTEEAVASPTGIGPLEGTEMETQSGNSSYDDGDPLEGSSTAYQHLHDSEQTRRSLQPRRRGTRYEKMVKEMKKPDYEDESSMGEEEDESPDYLTSRRPPPPPSPRPQGTSGSGNKEELTPKPAGGGKRPLGECRVCAHTDLRPRRRVRIATYCKTCQVFLCIDDTPNCFLDYHTLVNF